MCTTTVDKDICGEKAELLHNNYYKEAPLGHKYGQSLFSNHNCDQNSVVKWNGC